MDLLRKRFENLDGQFDIVYLDEDECGLEYGDFETKYSEDGFRSGEVPFEAYWHFIANDGSSWAEVEYGEEGVCHYDSYKGGPWELSDCDSVPRFEVLAQEGEIDLKALRRAVEAELSEELNDFN